MEHSTKSGNEQIFLAVQKEQVDAQYLRATVGIGIEGKTIDPQKPHEVDRTRRPDQKTTRDQKPQIRPHKNHTRTTKTKNAQSGL